MATPLIIQDSVTAVVAYLEFFDTGLPATGLIFSDVTAGLKKEGEDAFSPFTLTALNFIELDNGFYEIKLDAGDTDTLGSLYLNFVGSLVKNALVVAFVAEETAAPPAPSPGYTPTVTAAFGYIYDVLGVPKQGVRVAARVVSMPTLVHPTDQGIVIKTDLVTTSTDSSGFFSISLIAGTTVEFIIPEASYRRVVLIPGTDFNLIDLP